MGNQLGIVEATGDTWKTLKKLASGPFSLIRLKKSISLFNECYKHMLEYIEKELSSGNSVIEGANIFPQITYLAILMRTIHSGGSFGITVMSSGKYSPK